MLVRICIHIKKIDFIYQWVNLFNSKNSNMGKITKTKLIKINGIKLKANTLVNGIDVNKKCFVISMLGCARVGKSTFINGLLSYIFNNDIYIAETSTKTEHCTQGIDFISVGYKNINLIILDCQGLNYEDSKNDDKLLSFIYSVSNLIIYHDTNIINNQTLNTLTSLCLVSDCVKDNGVYTKPILYFRMRDYNLESPVSEIIERTFLNRNDQYDNVRKAIQKLFPVIKGIYTEPMGKKEQHVINKHEYKLLYDDIDEYNFKYCFDDILSNIDENNCLKTNALLNHISTTVSQINANNKITFENYDYYTLIINQKFKEFFVNIDKSIYDVIVISKHQSSIDKFCIKINKINKIIEEFKIEFATLDNSLIIKQINTFSKELLENINADIDKCHGLARDFINEHKGEIITKSLCSFTTQKIFTDENYELGLKFGTQINLLCDEKFRNEHICEDDIRHFIDDINSQLRNILTKIKILDDKNKIEILRYKNKINAIFESYTNDTFFDNFVVINESDEYLEITLTKQQMFKNFIDNILSTVLELNCSYENYYIFSLDCKLEIGTKKINNDIEEKIKYIHKSNYSVLDNIHVKQNNLIEKNIHNASDKFYKFAQNKIDNYISFPVIKSLTKSSYNLLNSDSCEYINRLYPITIKNKLDINELKIFEKYSENNNLGNKYNDEKTIILTKKMFEMTISTLCSMINYSTQIFNKFNVCDNNGIKTNIYAIDYSSIYGKYFINKIISKSIDDEFEIIQKL